MNEQPNTEAWELGIIARYLTVAGATIDLSRPSDDGGALHGECSGCGEYLGANADVIVKPRAQAHAEKCRALPRPAVTEAAARVLAKVAHDLDTDQPDAPMTEAARIGHICHHIPGQPELLDEVLPAAPLVTPGHTRREYAARLRAVIA